MRELLERALSVLDMEGGNDGLVNEIKSFLFTPLESSSPTAEEIIDNYIESIWGDLEKGRGGIVYRDDALKAMQEYAELCASSKTEEWKSIHKIQTGIQIKLEERVRELEAELIESQEWYDAMEQLYKESKEKRGNLDLRIKELEEENEALKNSTKTDEGFVWGQGENNEIGFKGS